MKYRNFALSNRHLIYSSLTGNVSEIGIFAWGVYSIAFTALSKMLRLRSQVLSDIEGSLNNLINLFFNSFILASI